MKNMFKLMEKKLEHMLKYNLNFDLMIKFFLFSVLDFILYWEQLEQLKNN